MTGRHVRETLFAAFLGLLAGVAFHFVVGTDVASGRSLDAVPRPVLAELLSQSLMRADVVACDVHRQGTVTLLDAAREGAASGRTVLTNAHVVQGASSATLSGAELGVHVAEVDGFLDERDAAVLELPEEATHGGAGLEVGPAPAAGDPVVLAGFPEGRWTITDGTVDSVELRKGWGALSEVLVVDVPIEQGISGGVVVDVAGRAVGLIAARDPDTGFAVAYPIDDVLAAGPGVSPAC